MLQLGLFKFSFGNIATMFGPSAFTAFVKSRDFLGFRGC